MSKYLKTILILSFILTALSPLQTAYSQNTPNQETITWHSDSYGELTITHPDGKVEKLISVNGPSDIENQIQSIEEKDLTEDDIILQDFPEYNWSYGCSATAASMMVAWYDRNGFPDLYNGELNDGVAPLIDTGWGRWSDVTNRNYPANPIIASKLGHNQRETRGSIDDYWKWSGSRADDPYIDGGWEEHPYDYSVGDYMRTSQSKFQAPDGATNFVTPIFSGHDNGSLTCEDIQESSWSDRDGTLGIKQFYEAHGYKVGDCYITYTDMVGSGAGEFGPFTFEDLKREIDNGHPLLLNLMGVNTAHSVTAYGYNDTEQSVFVRTTWTSGSGQHVKMPWQGVLPGTNYKISSIVVVHPEPEEPYIPDPEDAYMYIPMIFN